MQEFFETFKTELLYFLAVVLAVLILRLITNHFHVWLVKKEQARVPGNQPKTINLVRRRFDTEGSDPAY